ncbi:MAG TPA: DUF2934 domain-containing protein [Candidatus Acidoferrales bacterium]|nr:DUF2934 domain-containing protein [Candidatus Acidoferrales bacterium]
MARTPSRDEIEVRAYEIYEQRGCEDGHADDDWFAAERELTERSAPETGKSGSRIKEAVSQAMQQKSRSAGSAHN